MQDYLHLECTTAVQGHEAIPFIQFDDYQGWSGHQGVCDVFSQFDFPSRRSDQILGGMKTRVPVSYHVGGGLRYTNRGARLPCSRTNQVETRTTRNTRREINRLETCPAFI